MTISELLVKVFATDPDWWSQAPHRYLSDWAKRQGASVVERNMLADAVLFLRGDEPSRPLELLVRYSN